MSAHTVEVKNLSKIYSQKEKEVKKALDKINFYADCGQITGILGKNGAGKTSLIKTISAFHFPTEGSVFVCKSQDPVFIRKVTGYVSEVPELEKNMSVKELLYLNSSLYFSSKKLQEESIKKSIEITDIKDVLNCKIFQLSKGYKQRVNLAKTLSCNPKVLILDEFSAGLDPVQLKRLRSQIKKLSENKTVIISTHNIEEAENLCDRIYILNEGKISISGSIKEILKESKTSSLEEAFIKLSGENNF